MRRLFINCFNFPFMAIKTTHVQLVRPLGVTLTQLCRCHLHEMPKMSISTFMSVCAMPIYVMFLCYFRRNFSFYVEITPATIVYRYPLVNHLEIHYFCTLCGLQTPFSYISGMATGNLAHINRLGTLKFSTQTVEVCMVKWICWGRLRFHVIVLTETWLSS